MPSPPQPILPMRHFAIYDAVVQSEFPFRFPFSEIDAPANLTVEVVGGGVASDGGALIFETDNDELAPPLRRIERRADGTDLLTFFNEDQVELSDGWIRYRIVNESYEAPWLHHFVELRLWGSSCAWWLLRRGRLPMHGGAMRLDDGATLFMAVAGTGKSTLMASLINQGYPLLSDDLTPLWIDDRGVATIASGYPQMRMWPETVRQFVGDPADFAQVYPWQEKRLIRIGAPWGRFQQGQFPLKKIVLLGRREGHEGPITVEMLAGHEAFMTLMVGMFQAAVRPTRELPTIWEQLSPIVDTIPLFRLSYPSGWEQLPAVHAQLRQLAQD